MVFILDLPSSVMIQAIVELLCQEFDANIEIYPAMNLDELEAISSTQRQ
jgi:hypothetical protein